MRPRFLLVLLALLLPHIAAAAVLEVTNTNDDGPGSLRAALQAAATNDRIEFRIRGDVPASGWFTIRPQSLLPQLKRNGVVIDATTQTAFSGDTNPFGPEVEVDGEDVEELGPGLKLVDANAARITGLAVNNFNGNGIVVERGLVTIVSNYVGTDPTGTEARPNASNGVLYIGAQGTLSGNVISGNGGNGVLIFNSNVDVLGNRIGAGRTTAFAVPNGANGIDVSTYVTAIDGNVITYNHDDGITLSNGSGMVTMTRNEIWGNGFLSIDNGHDGVDVDDVLDVDRGANGHMNPPLITFARASQTIDRIMTIRGEIHTVANHEVYIDFYAAPHRSPLGLGETQLFLGHVRTATNPDGFAAFTYDVQPSDAPFIPGGWVVATAFASGAREGTSELSAPIAIEAPPRMFEVTNVEDDGPGSLRAAIELANATNCSREDPCRIAFHIDGGAVIEPSSPLPAIARDFVYVEGNTQGWWNRFTIATPAVTIRGTRAGADATGLRIGTEDAPLAEVAVCGVAIREFGGDGLVLHQRRERYPFRVEISRIDVSGNGGDGLVMYGGSGTEFWNQGFGSSGFDIVANDNGRSGVVMLDDANALGRVDAARNRFNGVYVRGSSCRIEGGTLAFNGGSGIATSPDARAVCADVVAFGNGGLGVDRNDDGVTPNDGTEADGILDAPEIASARWDPDRKKTIVSVHASQAFPKLPERQMWSHRAPRFKFYADNRDLGNFVERQIGGGAFEIALNGDLRGQWLTARRLMSLCFWELGCGAADSSEFSNAIRVE